MTKKNENRFIDVYSYLSEEHDFSEITPEQIVEAREQIAIKGQPNKSEGYKISSSVRGKLLDKKCSVCSNTLEKLYEKVWNSGPSAIIGPGSKAFHWKVKVARCTKCHIVFDY